MIVEIIGGIAILIFFVGLFIVVRNWVLAEENQQKLPKTPEIARIQDNISPVQFHLYFEDILEAVSNGFKLERSDNTFITFHKDVQKGVGPYGPIRARESKTVHAPIGVVQSDVFESYTFCGNCGEYDIHSMREPVLPQFMPQLKQEFTDEEINDIVVVHGPGGRKYVASESTGKKFGFSNTKIDEWNYKTIRKCNNCGHEWGQK